MTEKPTYEELEKRIQDLEHVENKLIRAEKALKESEDRYHAVVEDMLGLICNFLPGGVITFVNKAYCEYFGKTFEELVGTNFLSLIPESEQKAVIDNISALTVESPTQSHEHKVVAPNGDIRWQRWTNRALFDGQGKTVGYQSIGIDITDRKPAEEALRESEERLSRFMNSASDSFYLFDSDLNLIEINKKGLEIIGKGKDELIGKNITEIVPDIKTSGRYEKHLEVIRTGKSFEIDDFIPHPIFGELHFILKSFKVGGGLGVIATDITERKQAEEALRKERNRAQKLLDIAGVMFVAIDEKGEVILVNQRGSTILGYEQKEIIGKNWFDNFLPVSIKDQIKTVYNRLMAGEFEPIEYYENPILTKTGEERTIAWHNTILKDDDGTIIGTLSSGEDITERKQAEESLRTSHHTFLTVLDSIDATIYVADMKTYEILFMNKNMIETFGRDLTGEKCWDVFRGEFEQCSNCTNDQLIDENGKPVGVCIWQDKNPITEKWYINYDRAIEWIDGRLVRLQIATDITYLKQMEEKLRHAQKMEAIGTLASGIAHDFNNLLMGIQGRASLTSVELGPSHPCSEHINAIEEYIRNATDLTKQLLGFARGGKYEVKPTDINELVLSSSVMFGRTKKEIQIHTKLNNPSPVVEVDRRQIGQVLLNMYVNAWQAMPDGGELYLETRIVTLDDEYCAPHQAEPGRYVKVSVTDTGIGMDEATRQRVFDPFFTTKEKSRGTGLGLASAYGIIENHGGMISIYSEINYGTTFNIYLPLSKKTVNQDVLPEEEISRGSETILLVDDEEMIIEVGQAMLEKLGYRVVVAKGGEEAIQAVNKMGNELDLVILDLIMPGIDGAKTFDRIREIQPGIPVILSSGYAINGQANKIMRKGCNGFIQKPFNIYELSLKVRKIMDEAKSRIKDILSKA